MSKEGVLLATDALANMQETRDKLLNMGSSESVDPKSKSAQQDILLGQMLFDAKESVRDRFFRLASH